MPNGGEKLNERRVARKCVKRTWTKMVRCVEMQLAAQHPVQPAATKCWCTHSAHLDTCRRLVRETLKMVEVSVHRSFTDLRINDRKIDKFLVEVLHVSLGAQVRLEWRLHPALMHRVPVDAEEEGVCLHLIGIHVSAAEATARVALEKTLKQRLHGGPDVLR